jgi:hypothetical protein
VLSKERSLLTFYALCFTSLASSRLSAFSGCAMVRLRFFYPS